MRTFTNISVAVIATIWSFAQATYGEIWTEAEIQQYFADHPGESFKPANGDILEGAIHIPADVPPVLNAGTYTIEVLQDRTVRFQEDDQDVPGSLTITTQQGQGGNAVGRINAHGASGNLAVFDGVGGGAWGGITVLTDPGGGGNIISYCAVTHASNEAITVDGQDQAAQAEVKSCLIQNNGSIGVYVVGGNTDFRVWDNEICNSGIGIQIESVEDPINLEGNPVIARNVVHDNDGMGIYIHAQFTGGIVNNLSYHNAGTQLWLEFTNTDPVANNVVDGNHAVMVVGIQCELGWSPNMRNNIVVNCQTGVVTHAQGGGNLDYFLFFNNGINYGENIVAGVHCIYEDPQFVGGTDYHLMWTSPAVNTGHANAEYNDPDGSRNDMGIFGGPLAGEFSLPSGGNWADYCRMDGFVTGQNWTLKRDTYRIMGNIRVVGEELKQPSQTIRCGG